MSSILNLLLPEAQPYKNLFNSVEIFLKDLNKENWVSNYIYWELNLLKELGFDPYLEQFSKNLDKNLDHKIIEIDNTKYQVPIFLLKKREDVTIEDKNLSTGLSFTRNLLSNKFFLPNNLIFPKARVLLENYFN